MSLLLVDHLLACFSPCADFQRELKSVKHELKEVEQQLEELLTKQSCLLERRTELETVLHNDSAKKQQAADTQWERTGWVHPLGKLPHGHMPQSHSQGKRLRKCGRKFFSSVQTAQGVVVRIAKWCVNIAFCGCHKHFSHIAASPYMMCN